MLWKAAAYSAVTAVILAVTLAIVDVYLSGHGRPTLGRAWIDRGGVHLSRADAILLLGVLVAALIGGSRPRR